ncbi:hypothetical protein CYMTET_5000 [Cymbomonas tetramitiformis]|uniref:Uncharacterized protein n=1 Tax=Cymbomonas tetramitiformis TaxID=36881 RepID=A0AAE0LJH6_9CHLO|nr:hypothetical protein CYMTET_5000 [Cymbomonas tetramitiformis]
MDYTPLSYPFEQYQPFSDLTSSGKYVAELRWTPTSDDVERVLGGCPAPPIQEVWRLQVYVPEYSDIFSIRLGDTDVLIVELNDPYDAVASQCTTRGVYDGQTLRDSLGWDANAGTIPALFCRACNLGRDPNSVRDNPHGIDVTLVSDSCWAITPVDDRDNRHSYHGCSASNFQGRGFYYSGYADKKLCHWPTTLNSVSYWPYNSAVHAHCRVSNGAWGDPRLQADYNDFRGGGFTGYRSSGMAKAYANRGFVLERSVQRRDGGAAIMTPRLGVGKFGTCAERHYDIGVRYAYMLIHATSLRCLDYILDYTASGSYITLNDDYTVNSCMLFDFLSLNNELQLLNPLDDTDSFSGNDQSSGDEPVYLNHLCVANRKNKAHAHDSDGRLIELEVCEHFDREFTDVQFVTTNVNDDYYAGMSVVENHPRVRVKMRNGDDTYALEACGGTAAITATPADDAAKLCAYPWSNTDHAIRGEFYAVRVHFGDCCNSPRDFHEASENRNLLLNSDLTNLYNENVPSSPVVDTVSNIGVFRSMTDTLYPNHWVVPNVGITLVTAANAHQYWQANDASVTADAIVAVVQGCDHYIAQDVALSAGVVIGGRYTLTYRVAIRPGMNDA